MGRFVSHRTQMAEDTTRLALRLPFAHPNFPSQRLLLHSVVLLGTSTPLHVHPLPTTSAYTVFTTLALIPSLPRSLNRNSHLYSPFTVPPILETHCTITLVSGSPTL